MGMEDNGKSVGENDTKEVKYRGAKAMPFIIGNETFEKLGTIGTQSNLLVYLTTVFNMKSITATNLVNIYNGSANLATLLGAFLCDTYFGRYNTLGFASISSFLGMSVLTLTAAIHGLHPPHCESGQGRSNVCTGPTVGQVAFLLAGLAFMVVGAGGIRPCNLAFGADQFNPNTESGKRGVDSFFNWYYFTFTFAMMVSVTFIVYVQSNINWAIGLAIPAFLMFLSCMMFFIGTKIYVRVRPQGTPLASVARVIGAAFKKRHLNLAPQEEFVTFFDYVPKDSINSRLPHTPQFRFLEKGAILTKEDRVNSDGSASDPRSLSSMQQVEEVKCLIRVLPIWIAGIIYYISMVTQQNYAVFQALQSHRRLGQGNFQIPAASYTIFTMITLTIWIPIYDRLIIPLMRRITGKDKAITVLQRQGIGIALSVFAMLLSGVVEQMRRGRVLTRPTLGLDPQRGAISSLSSLWLVPQLALTGMSESFTMIGLVEFYYKQFPENMRSIGAAFLFCGCAMSSYLSSLLVSVVHRLTGGHGSGEATKRGNWLADDLNQGRLDYFYFLIAALEVANLMYFVVSARWYRYRGSSSGFDGGDSGKNEEKKSEIALV